MVASTGVVLQIQQFFGADEAEQERLATIMSTQLASAPVAGWQQQIDRALVAVKVSVGADVPIDSVEVQLKDTPRKCIVWTASGGGAKKDEPLKVTVNAESGAVLKTESGERESFILRVHTGEVFGDAGVVLGIIWGTALVVLTITGAWVYYRMWSARRRSLGAAVNRGATGLQKPRFGGMFWMLAFAVVLLGAQQHAWAHGDIARAVGVRLHASAA